MNAMNYNPELTIFTSTDGLRLPGLLYKPDAPNDSVALYLHGNGSSSIFYSARTMNAIAEKLNKQGIAFFPFNNRGAHFIKSLKKGEGMAEERVQMGMTYELIRECIFDIDGAIRFLADKGYKKVYLVGMSTGANKICVYDKYAGDERIEKYILLSGGDDTGLYYTMLGKERFFEALNESRKKVEEGKGIELAPSSYIEFPLSYQSLYDTINPEGDYNIFPFLDVMNGLHLSEKEPFSEYSALKKPTLVLYGSEDEYCYNNVIGCMSILRQRTEGKTHFTYALIQGTDHGFSDAEQKLANSIADFLN